MRRFMSWGLAPIALVLALGSLPGPVAANPEGPKAMVAAANPAAADTRTQQVGTYYAACLDTASIDAAGVTPIANDLARAAAIGTGAPLVAEVAHLHDLGIEPFFNLGAEPNPDGAAKPEILSLNQTSLSLPDKS